MPFNDFLKRLLGSGKNLPTCTATRRPAGFVAAYREWLSQQAYLNWTGPLFLAYHYKKAGLPAPYRVQLLAGENLKGVIFFYDPSIGAESFSFLFELLKDRVQQQGYALHSHHTLRVRHAEQVEKLILTPPASELPGTGLCNQLYGNILLDYVKVNRKPGYIRLAANSYQDPFFSEARPFEELLENALQPDEKPQK